MTDDRSPTQQRNHVADLARSDQRRAEAVAATIQEPWYRCQAYAHIARFADTLDEVGRLATQAIDAAGDSEEAYEQVAASAWPIRALFEREHRDLALQCLEIALTAAPRIRRESSRAEALLLLLHAAFDSGRDIRRSLVYAIAELHDSAPHWRVKQALTTALALTVQDDPEFVHKVLSGSGVLTGSGVLKGSGAKTAGGAGAGGAGTSGDPETGDDLEAERALEPQEPREFFW